MNVLELLQYEACSPKREGSQLTASCVNCGKRMYVTPVEGLYYCHHCQTKGNAFKMVQQMHPGWSPKRIMNFLAEFGHESQEPETKAGKKATKEEPNWKALDAYRAKLREPRGQDLTWLALKKKVAADSLLYFEPLTEADGRVIVLPAFSPADRQESGEWRPRGFLKVRRDGKPFRLKSGEVKYPIVPGSKLGLLGVRRVMQDNPTEVWFVEAWRDALAIIAQGKAAVCSIGGASTWKDEWLPVFEGRDVVLCFDQDKAGERARIRAGNSIAKVAESVRQFVLPYEMRESKGKDLHDWITEGHRIEDAELEPFVPEPAAPSPQPRYEAKAAGIVWHRPTRNGTVPEVLTNFDARIIEVIELDDGVTEKKLFCIRVTLPDGRQKTVIVAASEFSKMAWPLEMVGPDAIIQAGPGYSQHVRAAIQTLSTDVKYSRKYAYTGWVQIGEEWVNLDGGGAIGADGILSDIGVELPEPLSRYRMLPPVDLPRAIRECLEILRVIPFNKAVVLFSAVWRAILGNADLTVWLAGKTGIGKTQIAALLQQFFGAGMDAAHLPGNWSSTAYALEALAHAVKDRLFVVDDFLLTGPPLEVQRHHAKADHLCRGAANGSGRQRLAADTSMRPTRHCRGLILATAEDRPNGASLVARLFIVELTPEDMDWGLLTRLQAVAAKGTFSKVAFAFIQFIAKQYEAVQKETAARAAELREKASRAGIHRRTPSMVASLFSALEVFVAFAKAEGGISAEDGDEFLRLAWDGMIEIAGQQASGQRDTDPAKGFLGLLMSAISSGRAHVRTVQGERPDSAECWGWSRSEGEYGLGSSPWSPRGDLIGWYDDEHGLVYLDQNTAYRMAKSMDADHILTVSMSRIRKHLADSGLIVADEGHRETACVRRTICGVRRSVLAVPVAALTGDLEEVPREEVADGIPI